MLFVYVAPYRQYSKSFFQADGAAGCRDGHEQILIDIHTSYIKNFESTTDNDLISCLILEMNINKTTFGDSKFILNNRQPCI